MLTLECKLQNNLKTLILLLLKKKKKNLNPNLRETVRHWKSKRTRQKNAAKYFFETAGKLRRESWTGVITVDGPPYRRSVTMRAVRLLFSLRRVAASPSPPVAFFSSSSSLTTKSTNSVATEAKKGGSLHRNRPKFKWNSVSFFGTVEQPLRVQTRNGRTVSAWTILRAKLSPDSNCSFR